MDRHRPSEHPGHLRQHAEARYQSRYAADDLAESNLSPDEARALLHELHVHQIELELQNEELRQRQVELEMSWSRYFDLYDQAPVGYFTLDAQGAILSMNLTGADLVGRTRGSFIGQPITRYIHPEDQDAFDHLRRRLFETHTQQTGELRLICSDARPMWIRLEVTTLLEPGGDTSMRGTFHDITDHVENLVEREKLTERMVQFQKLEAVDSLAAGIAHNMNNVLAAILGYSSLGEMRSTDPFDLEAFRIITAACERGKDIVASLLQFVRTKPPLMNPMELNSQLKGITQLLERSAHTGSNLVLDLAAEDLWLEGDSSNISQAFINLCVNAFDAMPEGGTLTIRTFAMAADRIQLEVEDTGEGMRPEVLRRVMEPFFTTKPIGKGTGLGLSMAYGVIKAHGGTLGVQSQPGVGTCVTIQLPRIVSPALLEPVLEEKRSYGPLNILLVDDEEFIRGALVSLFEMDGFRVKAVGSGQEALDSLASEGPPDLVLLDVNMPGMNGIETLAHIRTSHPTLPVLIASGRQDLFDLECVTQPHVSAISKPYSVKAFKAKLEDLGFPAICRVADGVREAQV